MRQAIHRLTLATTGKGLYEFTDTVTTWLRKEQFQTGLLTIFIRHTSASLLIQENADPDVIEDLNRWFSRLVPEDDPIYRHTAEGPDDMPAHIRTALTAVHLGIPIVNGKLVLGAWQGIYLWEHRTWPHQRLVMLHAFGD